MPTAREIGIDAALASVRGFVTHRDVPPAAVAALEEALLSVMEHKVYQGFLASVDLPSDSVAGAGVWSGDLERILADMEAAMEVLGLEKPEE